MKFAAGIIEIGALGLEQWPREVENIILVCQRDIYVLCICILYMYSVYVLCICIMYMYYVYVNKNNNNNPRVLGARGNLEKSNPAKETTHSGRGEKETHYMNVVGKKGRDS